MGQKLVHQVLPGKTQLSPADAEITRKIANVMIHEERVICSTGQKYLILRGPIPIDLLDSDPCTNLTVVGKVAQVHCALSNSPSVLDFE